MPSSRISRRTLLGATAAVAVLGHKSASAALMLGHGSGSLAAPAGNLTAEITFPGGSPTASTVVFDQSTGTDLGSYVAPTAGFTQQCIRCTNALLTNFSVDFRPDLVGGRVEVVFWNGECMGTVPSNTATRDLPAYNVVVKRGGVPISDYKGMTGVLAHNWGNRWRFQTAARPLIRAAAQVYSGGFLPNMATTPARLSGNNLSTGQPWSGLPYSNVPSGGSVIVPPVPTVPTTATNDGTNWDGSNLAIGTTPYVSSGTIYQFPGKQNTGTGRFFGLDCAGDDGSYRFDIGLVTEWQAHWLLSNNLDMLNVFFQQAEFMASQANGLYIRDQVTGGPVNLKTDATHYSAAMGVAVGHGGYDINVGSGEYHSKGDEHSPQVWYLPWVLTEDPFYCEANQYHETYANCAAEVQRATFFTGINGTFTCFSFPASSEERGLGWATKNVANCFVMSPTSGPSWLLPQSYWASVSSDYSAVVDHYRGLSPTDPYFTVFHSIDLGPNGDTPQTFYKAYVSYCLAFADLVGLTVPAAPGHSAPSSWLSQLTFMFDFIRQVTDSSLASGWNVQCPIINDLGSPLQISNSVPTSGCTIGSAGVPPSGQNCWLTFSALWTAAAGYLHPATNPYPSNPSPGFQGGDPVNLSPLRAGIAAAKSRGVTGAATCLTFIDTMVDYSYPQSLFQFPVRAQDGITGT